VRGEAVVRMVRHGLGAVNRLRHHQVVKCLHDARANGFTHFLYDSSLPAAQVRRELHAEARKQHAGISLRPALLIADWSRTYRAYKVTYYGPREFRCRAS
jgi:hypothetical protein